MTIILAFTAVVFIMMILKRFNVSGKDGKIFHTHVKENTQNGQGNNCNLVEETARGHL